MKLCFLVRQLNGGGTEKQLLNLVSGLSKNESLDITVITFYPGGQFSEPMSKIPRVRLISLDKKGRYSLAGFLFKLVQKIREIKPDVLHSYLNLPNDLAGLLRPFFPRTRVVWGIRSAYLDLDQYDMLERFLFGMERKLSRRADMIIANSDAGREYAINRGFVPDSMRVIYNGIDTDEFRCDRENREELRRSWGLSDEHVAIGIVGRLDPMKDHDTFLHAADIYSRQNPNARFICVGRDDNQKYASGVKHLCKSLGLADRTVWTGRQTNMPAVYSALDILASSSYGESFPNVIGEAMACEVPCVVTNVGDSANIVGDTGIVVPAKDAISLASGWRTIAQSDRASLGSAARARIAEKFSLARMIEQTEDALCHLA